MPQPNPLTKRASKKAKRKRVGDVMSELKHGPVNAPSRKATIGKQRQRQNIAIALKSAGMSRKRPAKRESGYTVQPDGSFQKSPPADRRGALLKHKPKKK